MKNQIISVLVFGVAVWISTAYAVQPVTGAVPQASAKHGPAKAGNQTRSAGAELFATHCGRCHQPPEELSPRVVPAVLAHMRTRAMLSQRDEQELLKFLAPQ